MKPRARLRPRTVLAAIACAGCIRSADPLAPESDALVVTAMLVAGESEVHLLAAHPHRSQSDLPPEVAVRLMGPGWETTFSEETDLADCGITDLTAWPGTLVCLRARLPEAIRERTLYRIAGTGPAGSFSGATVVPSAPVITEPADGNRVPPQSEGDYLTVPIRYEVPSDVAMLHSGVIDAVEIQSDGSPKPVGPISCQPLVLDLEEGHADLTLSRDSPSLYKRIYLGRPVHLSIQLLGPGRNYADFVNASGKYPLRQPWPSFGLEGAYGYFAGAAPSNPVRIVVRRDPSADDAQDDGVRSVSDDVGDGSGNRARAAPAGPGNVHAHRVSGGLRP